MVIEHEASPAEFSPVRDLWLFDGGTFFQGGIRAATVNVRRHGLFPSKNAAGRRMSPALCCLLRQNAPLHHGPDAQRQRWVCHDVR